MRYFITLSLVTLLFAITGCKNNECYKQLELADTLTGHNLTDSAAYILNNVERTYTIREGKEKAYYNLLKYQLRFRNEQKNISDSLIDYSINFYSKHNDAHKLALSYYLKGRVRRKNNDNKGAITYLKKAESSITRSDDNYLKARIYNSITVINNAYENFDAALVAAKKAVAFSKKSNNSEILLDSYLNIIFIYSSLNKTDSSIIYENKCFDNISIGDSIQKPYIYTSVAANIMNKDSAKAREYALESIKIKPNNNAYQILAELARNQNNYELSEIYLTEALKYSINADWESSILCELADTKDKLGKHSEARELSKRVIILRDSVEKIHARDSIKEIQLASEMENKTKAVVEQKDNTITVIGIGSLAAIAISYALLYLLRRTYQKNKTKAEQQISSYRHDIKKKEDEIKQKDTEIEQKNKKIKQKENQIKKKDDRLEKKISEKAIARADKIVEKQMEKMKAEAARQREAENASFNKGFTIYNKVKELKELFDTAADVTLPSDTVANASAMPQPAIEWDKEAVKALTVYYRTISPAFKQLADTHNEELTEYQLTLLILKDMGLNNKQTATIMNISYNAIRTQMSRINKKGITFADDA